MEILFLSAKYLTVPTIQELRHSPWIWGLKENHRAPKRDWIFKGKLRKSKVKSNMPSAYHIPLIATTTQKKESKHNRWSHASNEVISLHKKTCDQLEMAGEIVILHCSIISSVQSGSSKYLSPKWGYNFCPHDFPWPSVQDTAVSNICNFLLL